MKTQTPYAKLTKWAQKNGYTFRPVYRNSGDALPNGILIDTDYTGAYPPADIYDLHNDISKWAYQNGFSTQPRGFRTGICVFQR